MPFFKYFLYCLLDLKPRPLQLGNGISVLSSGRPGIQLRFSRGNGNQWSDAFELVPYKMQSDQVSFGYPGLIATGDDRFFIVYADFQFETKAEEPRKTIKVREVVLTRQ